MKKGHLTPLVLIVPKFEFLQDWFHVHIRIVFLPRVIRIQWFIRFGKSGAFPVEHRFHLILYITILIMVFRPVPVKFMGQFLAKDGVENHLIQVMEWKTISIIFREIV